MEKEIYNNFLREWAEEEYPIERYETKVDYVNNSYLFTLDYGTSISSSCSVSMDDTVFVDYGVSTIFDNDELSQRKEDIIKEILEPMFGDEAKKLVENGMEKIASAFEKTEAYVINNVCFCF